MNANAVGADSGLNWLTEGWRLFVLNPGMWIALFIVNFVIMFVLMWIPLIGKLAAALLTPGLLAGMMTAARELDSGRDISIETLFAPLQDESKRTPLLTLGAIYLGGMVLAGVIVLLVGGTAMMGGAMMHGGGAGILALAGTMGFFAIVMLLLWAVFASLFMYAVPLVTFDGIQPIEALKQAYSALLKNIVPLLVFGVISFVLAIVATAPVMLGWLVLGPVLAGATYTSYKQLFGISSSTQVVQ